MRALEPCRKSIKEPHTVSAGVDVSRSGPEDVSMSHTKNIRGYWAYEQLLGIGGRRHPDLSVRRCRESILTARQFPLWRKSIVIGGTERARRLAGVGLYWRVYIALPLYHTCLSVLEPGIREIIGLSISYHLAMECFQVLDYSPQTLWNLWTQLNESIARNWNYPLRRKLP